MLTAYEAHWYGAQGSGPVGMRRRKEVQSSNPMSFKNETHILASLRKRRRHNVMRQETPLYVYKNQRYDTILKR